MKQLGVGLFALLGPVLLAQQVPEISYYSVPDLLKLPRKFAKEFAKWGRPVACGRRIRRPPSASEIKVVPMDMAQAGD